jgi:transposase
MAYREHGMWEILEVLRRVHGGEPLRSVARGTGRPPKTVRRYVRLAGELGWSPGGAAPPGEPLAGRVAARLRPGPATSGPTETESVLGVHLDELRDWLAVDTPERRGLTLTKAHILLGRRGVDVKYSALHRFAQKHLDFGRTQATVRMADCEPGELAEVDFGKLGLVHDPAAGRNRVLHALVITLVHSRHQYVHVSHSQKLDVLIGGLEDAWEFFGGCPRRVVIDNMKTAVTKADRYDPTFQRTFDQYARYRGFVIDAAVPASPKNKPHVERQVPYVRENFFRGEQFLDQDDAQRRATAWCLGQAGTRIHGTTRRQPLVEFETKERAVLLPLEPRERFDTPQWSEPRVHPDCHIRHGNALYSVPYTFIGKQVTVRSDRALVRIYSGGERIKLHARQPPGGRSTDYADYPPHKSEYAMRDPDRLLARACAAGKPIGAFAAKLLAGDFPWAKLRQAQALMRLVDKYGALRVGGACERAIAFDLINVRRLETMIERALEQEASGASPSPATSNVVQLPFRFARTGASFRAEATITEEEIVNGD